MTAFDCLVSFNALIPLFCYWINDINFLWGKRIDFFSPSPISMDLLLLLHICSFQSAFGTTRSREILFWIQALLAREPVVGENCGIYDFYSPLIRRDSEAGLSKPRNENWPVRVPTFPRNDPERNRNINRICVEREKIWRSEEKKWGIVEICTGLVFGFNQQNNHSLYLANQVKKKVNYWLL